MTFFTLIAGLGMGAGTAPAENPEVVELTLSILRTQTLPLAIERNASATLAIARTISVSEER